MMNVEQKEEGKCPSCNAKMRKSFSSISGNSKFVSFQCDCGHKETKCMGMVSERERF